ncbi:hypothetical protein [Lignipirellula cremea]|uniref:Transposase DDE domain-containing protein n=1 Tax=Lignipirellula cremea TaxID=2528010 RepID=A0A518DRS6_9BACT|nr:hypothetical protein [Lignipirellula cremea]QDU94547.1 hypothetical protein Pla8534_23380 [Lignipirellula cremea]
MCDTGGARRTWLTGIGKVRKRYLIAAVARNLGLLMRRVLGMGTPKGWAALWSIVTLLQTAWLTIKRHRRLWRLRNRRRSRLMR